MVKERKFKFPKLLDNVDHQALQNGFSDRIIQPEHQGPAAMFSSVWAIDPTPNSETSSDSYQAYPSPAHAPRVQRFGSACKKHGVRVSSSKSSSRSTPSKVARRTRSLFPPINDANETSARHSGYRYPPGAEIGSGHGIPVYYPPLAVEVTTGPSAINSGSGYHSEPHWPVEGNSHTIPAYPSPLSSHSDASTASSASWNWQLPFPDSDGRVCASTSLSVWHASGIEQGIPLVQEPGSFNLHDAMTTLDCQPTYDDYNPSPVYPYPFAPAAYTRRDHYSPITNNSFVQGGTPDFTYYQNYPHEPTTDSGLNLVPESPSNFAYCPSVSMDNCGGFGTVNLNAPNYPQNGNPYPQNDWC